MVELAEELEGGDGFGREGRGVLGEFAGDAQEDLDLEDRCVRERVRTGGKE